MSWDDFWAFYRHSVEDIRTSLLWQIDLDNFLPDLPMKVQQEILESAPLSVIEHYRYLLTATPVKIDTKGAVREMKKLVRMFKL